MKAKLCVAIVLGGAFLATCLLPGSAEATLYQL
jgi:hypothetical protein